MLGAVIGTSVKSNPLSLSLLITRGRYGPYTFNACRKNFTDYTPINPMNLVQTERGKLGMRPSADVGYS